jgi:hypothetical protein
MRLIPDHGERAKAVVQRAIDKRRAAYRKHLVRRNKGVLLGPLGARRFGVIRGAGSRSRVVLIKPE